MNGKTVLLTVLLMVTATAIAPGMAIADDPPFDTDDVEITAVNGENPDQVNDLPIRINEDIHIELSGVEEFDRPVMVEIGGEVVSHMEEPEQEMRPRSDSTVTTGQQTLQIVYDDRGDRTVIAETEVDVTEVVLDRDELDEDDDGLDYDPANVEIATLGGQDADQVNDIEIVWNEQIEIELDGIDATEHVAKVELDGTRIGYISQGENSFRPLVNRDISEGEQTLSLYLERNDERIDIAETQVDVTRVDLTQDDQTGLDFDPGDVTIASINGERPDQVNDIAIRIDEDFHLELDGIDEFDRPVMVEIGGEVVSHMEEPDQAMRPRTGSDVTTGQQTLKVIYEKRGDRTVIAETEVHVTEVILDSDEIGDDGLEYDPATVEIASVNGQDADKVNDIEVVWNEEIEIELDGIDTTEHVAHVGLDGTRIGYISEGENSFRPRPNRDISEGEQTLSLYLDRNDERIDIAETQVDVTRVDLTQDDTMDLDFDPAAVSLDTVNGQDASDLSLALRYDEEVSFSLDGLDATNHVLMVDLDGTTIGIAGEGENSFRPRSDTEIEPGEHQLTIRKRHLGGQRPIVAETTVTVTEVQFDRDDDREQRTVLDPEAVSIASVNGEPADQRNELRLVQGSTVAIELEGTNVPERGLVIEIGGDVVGILESSGEPVRVRSNSDVSEGAQTLAVVWRDEGDRTVLAESEVDVTEVNLGDGSSDIDPETVDLEIVSVNGQPADGVVVTEHDLRAETPIEMEVEGLSETELQPSIRYKGETIPADVDGFTIEGDRISLDHLPRVEDGETETLELVKRTGAEEVHVFDSVEIEYRHVSEGDSDGGGGGIMNSIMKFLGGGDDSSSNEDDGENGTDSDDESVGDDESDSTDDDGGIISIIRGLFE